MAEGAKAKASVAADPRKPLKEARDNFEKEYMINLLQLCGGNVSQAAKMAGKYRAEFYDIMKKHGLNTADFKKPS